jgi:hypothetical protein
MEKIEELKKASNLANKNEGDLKMKMKLGNLATIMLK